MIMIDPMRSADPKVLAPDYYSRTAYSYDRHHMMITTNERCALTLCTPFAAP
jgi:hypothetical protein